MNPSWEDCEHKWEEVESQLSNEFVTEVRCKKCDCPGEMNLVSGEVYWPAT
jgi:hypothetical protein